MKLKINLPTVFLLIDIKNGLEKRDQKIVTIPIPLINEINSLVYVATKSLEA